MMLDILKNRLESIKANKLESVTNNLEDKLKGVLCPEHGTEIKFNVVKNNSGIVVQSVNVCCEKGNQELQKKASEVFQLLHLV